jgi:hypothetical protein
MFDFNYWVKLYKENPERFNQERLALLREKARDNPRIMALINGWDMRLNRIKNPIARQAKLEALFIEQVQKFQDVLNGALIDETKDNG